MRLWRMKISELRCDKGAKVFECRGTQISDFVEQTMVEFFFHLHDVAAHPAQIHHHAIQRIGLAAKADLGLVGMAMHAGAALRLDLALERVGGIKKEALADGVDLVLGHKNGD